MSLSFLKLVMSRKAYCLSVVRMGSVTEKKNPFSAVLNELISLNTLNVSASCLGLIDWDSRYKCCFSLSLKRLSSSVSLKI